MVNSKPDRQNELILEIYKKISIPLSCLAFVILSVPLGIRRKVEGRFSGIVYSLALFIFYYILMALSENLGKTLQLPAILAAFAPNIIIAVLGLFLVRNLNQEEHTGVSQAAKRFWVRGYEKAQ